MAHPVVIAVLLSLCTLLGACAAPRASSTRFTNDDLTEISTQFAEKLRSSDFLANRDAASPPYTIALTKVVNYTSDIISDGERWYVMERVMDSLPLRKLARERSISFVVAKDRLDAATESGDEAPTGRRSPTHTMNATFRSTTYSGEAVRTDAYYCQCQITDLADSILVWSDRFEFKREAFGRSYN